MRKMSKEVKKLKIPLELDVSVIRSTPWVQIYIKIFYFRQDSKNFLNNIHFIIIKIFIKNQTEYLQILWKVLY